MELISHRGKEIKFCIGCLKCQETGACVFKGHLFCGGVNDPHEISGHAKLQEAYELGKNI